MTKKRIISALVTLSLAVALVFVAIPKEQTPKDLPTQAYQFFLENGFTEEQAVSIVALIQNSSDFDSSAKSNDGNFFGLCQWGFQRLENLEDFANKKGTEISDFQTQLEFIVSEIQPGEDYQLVAFNGFKPEDWEKADSIEDASQALVWTYFRPSPNLPIDEQVVEMAKSFAETV